MSVGATPPGREGRDHWYVLCLLRKFITDRRGNLAILFTVMSAVVFMFLGGTVDYARYNSVRTDILESLDAASLAVARMEEVHGNWTPDQLMEYGERFFVENAKHENALLKSDHTAYSSISDVIKFDLLIDDTKIQACVDGSIETHLLAAVNIEYFDIEQCVTINKAGASRIELALVLDMTGSMRSVVGGEEKMQSLKRATVILLDTIFGDETQSDNVKIGIVPFNQHVNAGSASSWNETWSDQNADSFYHGSRFIHVEPFGLVDPDKKVNHFRLYDSDGDADWTGCFESRPYPLDELDTPPGRSTGASVIAAAMSPPSSADEPDVTMQSAFNSMPPISAGQSLGQLSREENSRFVPVFIGDDPDCDTNFNFDDRCAAESGDPFWDEADLVRASFLPYYHSFERNFYSRPKAAGYDEVMYTRKYIDDELYIGRNAGEEGAAYGSVVRQFQDLSHVNNGAAHAFRDRMVDIGVRSDRFADHDVNNHSSNNDLDYDEFILRGAYVGWWDLISRKYKFKYDLAKDDPTFAPNLSDCPPALLPLTDDRLLIDGDDTDDDGLPDGGMLKDLYTTGETNIPNGAMWGWRVVSDALPFTESTGPADTGPNGSSESDWRRAVLIMTDGENTVYPRNNHRKSSLTSYGYAAEERMGDGVDTADKMVQEMDNKLLRICRRMKQENIEVYTVVFDVTAGSNIDQRMKACASKPIAPYYFNAPNASELKDAFKDIAENLSSLHVSH